METVTLHMLLKHLEPDVEAGCNHNTGEMEAETRGRGIWSQPSDIGKHFLKYELRTWISQ